jgi:hypothetical protein
VLSRPWFGVYKASNSVTFPRFDPALAWAIPPARFAGCSFFGRNRESVSGAALLGVDAVTLRRALKGPDDLRGSPARGKSPASVRACDAAADAKKAQRLRFFALLSAVESLYLSITHPRRAVGSEAGQVKTFRPFAFLNGKNNSLHRRF